METHLEILILASGLLLVQIGGLCSLFAYYAPFKLVYYVVRGLDMENKEIIWCDKPELKITSDVAPCTGVCKPLPTDSKAVKKYKKKFPYINRRKVIFTINYLGTTYNIKVAKGFRWNGTNCLGLQHNPKLLDASMVHDLLCNVHSLVNNDRQLSSMIFREIGIASGVNKPFMIGAYHAVDNFQKLFGKDLEGNKWK